jgi:hypothetical protein
MAVCYNCGTPFPREMPITRSEECPRCLRPVRCCRNCRFYAPGAHWDCHETVPEQVFDKERSNFCDYFRLNASSASSDTGVQSGGKTPGTSPRSAFDDLFS